MWLETVFTLLGVPNTPSNMAPMVQLFGLLESYRKLVFLDKTHPTLVIHG
jgi:hypothetical protein